MQHNNAVIMMVLLRVIAARQRYRRTVAMSSMNDAPQYRWAVA
jgi:hypothetical protein